MTNQAPPEHRLHPGGLSSKAQPRAQIEGSTQLARALKSTICAPGGCLSRSHRSVLQDERTEHRNNHSSRAFNLRKIGAEKDLARTEMNLAERKFRQEQSFYDCAEWNSRRDADDQWA